MSYEETKFCAAIITYNPEIVRFNENLKALEMNAIKTVFIVDNGSQNCDEIMQSFALHSLLDVHFSPHKNNIGIAAALNEALSMANELGFTWLLTMDQDSVCSDGFIKAMKPYTNKENIGIVAPSISDPRKEHADNLHANPLQRFLHKWIITIFLSEMFTPITSGALTNIKAALKVGGFSEDFFIDAVDYDFDLKLYENNYKIAQCDQAVLEHSVGNPLIYPLLGFKFIASGHPAWRRYYMARNAWLMKKRHKTTPQIKKWCTKNLLRTLCPIIMMETYIANHFKAEYVTYVLRGHIDGVRGKLCTHEEVLTLGKRHN